MKDMENELDEITRLSGDIEQLVAAVTDLMDVVKAIKEENVELHQKIDRLEAVRPSKGLPTSGPQVFH